MVQQILDDMRTYLEDKTSLTEQEQNIWGRLNEGFFPITSVSREDLQACGFDTRSITDGQMCDLAKKWRMITVSNFSGQVWRLSLKDWSSRNIRNVRSVATDTSASMNEPKHSVAKDADKNGTNTGMYWSNLPKTRLISRRNTSAIPPLKAVTTAQCMFRNMIMSPVSRNSPNRTDVLCRFAGRNHSRIFSPASRTILPII